MAASKKFKRGASVALAFSLLFGGSVVVAAPAQASVVTNCYNWYAHGTNRVIGYGFYIRYNVVEKLFGARDHWEYRYNSRGCWWVR